MAISYSFQRFPVSEASRSGTQLKPLECDEGIAKPFGCDMLLSTGYAPIRGRNGRKICVASKFCMHFRQVNDVSAREHLAIDLRAADDHDFVGILGARPRDSRVRRMDDSRAIGHETLI